jgi:1-acyl-sn-glycerol-3-phosphate acyltransferase
MNIHHKSTSEIKAEYDRAKHILTPIFIPFQRFITTFGRENIVKTGPNLIIANHPGIGRDIAGILNTYDRQLYFVIAHYVFDAKEFVADHMRPVLGKFFPVLSPLAKIFSKYLAKRLKQFEMIPINKKYSGNRADLVRNIRTATNKVKEYLQDGRAVVMFQLPLDMLKTMARQKVKYKSGSIYHPYIPNFNSTVGKIIVELYNESGLVVPVTPISIYGAEGMNPFKRAVFNVGKPMDIQPFADANSGSRAAIDFTDRLEHTVADLLIESGLPASPPANTK